MAGGLPSKFLGGSPSKVAGAAGSGWDWRLFFSLRPTGSELTQGHGGSPSKLLEGSWGPEAGGLPCRKVLGPEKWRLAGFWAGLGC